MNDRVLSPLIRRIRLALGRGIVRLVNDADGIQKMQVGIMANETRSKVERFQEYGFTSVPLAGAEAAIISMGGNRDHSVIVAVDDRRYRLKSLEDGEVAIYTDEGDKIHLKRDNNIEIVTGTLTVNATDEIIMNAGTRIDLNAPDVDISDDLGAGGSITATGDVEDHSGTMQEIRDIYNGHTHPGDSGGTTGTPNQDMD